MFLIIMQEMCRGEMDLLYEHSRTTREHRDLDLRVKRRQIRLKESRKKDLEQNPFAQGLPKRKGQIRLEESVREHFGQVRRNKDLPSNVRLVDHDIDQAKRELKPLNQRDSSDTAMALGRSPSRLYSTHPDYKNTAEHVFRNIVSPVAAAPQVGVSANSTTVDPHYYLLEEAIL